MTRARFRAVFLAAIMVLSAVAMGAGFVGGAAAQSGDEIVVSEGDSIQDAVDNATTGDTIYLQSGTYDQQISIEKDLTIIGESDTVISYDSASGSSYGENSFIIVENNSTVELDGLSIEGPFTSSNTAGIFIRNNGSVNATNVAMRQMFVPENGEPSGTQNHGAIALGHNKYTESTSSGDVHLSNSEIDGFGKFAVLISGGRSTATIHQTTINGSGKIDTLAQDAILVDEGRLLVEGSQFNAIRSTGNTGTGISVYGPSEKVVIRENSFSGVNKAVSLQSYREFDDSPGVIEDVVIKQNNIENQFQAIDIFSERSLAGTDDTVVSNLTYTQNEIRDGNTGLAAWTGQVVSSNISGNVFENNTVQVYQPRGTFRGSNIIDANQFDRAALVGSANSTIYSEIQLATDNNIYDASPAQSGDVVTVYPGVYNESVTISTQNVTLRGPNAGISDEVNRSDEAVIQNSVDVRASDVKISGFEINSPGQQGTASPTDYAGQVGVNVHSGNENVTISHNVITDIGTADDDANAIGVLASDGTSGIEIDSNEISNLIGTDEDEGAVQAVLIDESGTQITDATVTNNLITGLLDTRSTVAIRYNGDVQGNISENNISDLNTEGTIPGSGGAPGGFTQAISLAEGGGSDTGPSEVTITGNTITAIETTTTENFARPYGVLLGGSTDADSVTLKRNNIALDLNSGERTRPAVAVANGADERLDATLNYWGDADGPNTTEDIILGNITPDPFLTVAAESVDDPVRRTTDFGHDLIIPADGEPHSVAFPAAVEGNVSEVFGDFDGTIYAYDGDEWKSGTEVRDEDIDALDAFAVSVDEGEAALRIGFEYAETDSPVPSMTAAELEQGWNFVGAPHGNAGSDDAFAGSTGDITTVIDAIAGPESRTTPYGLDASGEVTNPDEVSPFKGYWVFVTDDGELGATVPVDPTQETEEGALTGN